jgi:hypothetical protein
MEDAFLAVFGRHEAGGGRVLSKVYPKTAGRPSPVCLPQSTSRTTPTHHRQQLSNTEKIERLASC